MRKKHLHHVADPKAALYGENEAIRSPILASLAFRNLFYKKLRTSLTIIGVIVGIGAVVFLLAFGYGLRDLVTSQVVDSNSIRTIDVSQANAAVIELDTDAENKISEMNDVEDVSRVYNYAAQVVYEDAKTGVVLYGVDQQFIDLSSYKLIEGPNLSVKDKGKIIVNSSFLKAIGVKDAQSIVNKKIKLTVQIPAADRPEGSTKEVLTIDASVSSVIDSGAGSEIYVSSDVFTEAGLENASEAKVLVANKNAVPLLQKRISSMGFTTSSPLDTVEQIDQLFSVLNLLFLGFGSIGLAVCLVF